jgi:hypothetical protein
LRSRSSASTARPTTSWPASSSSEAIPRGGARCRRRRPRGAGLSYHRALADPGCFVVGRHHRFQ